jgi:single-strand DNA-binding protein
LVPAGSNLVVLRGLIRRDPEFRVLPSGDELLALDLTVRDGELPAESVPVVWHNPAAAAAKLVEGDDVVVVGRVKRRFFRAGGSTASRTEVHADKVLSARSAVRIRSLLEPRVEDLNL